MRASLLLIIAAAVLTCLAGLGRAAISDSDEAFYAEAAREMVESGDYLTPRFNYAHRFQKPVLYYWLAAAGFEVAGVSEAAARLPSALSGIALALLTWWCARRWYGEAVGRTAGLVIATSIGCVVIARLSLPDLPLAFFISLATVLAFVAVLERDEAGLGWLVGAAVAAALGFLTKGPLALILPGLVLAPLVLIERRWRVLRPSSLALAALVFVAVAAPWYVAMTREHGVAYLHGFFVGDNLERFATDRFNAPRPLWFYLPIAAGGMLPWTPLSLAAVPRAAAWLARRAPLDARAMRLLVWAGLPLLLFTASIGKQPRYILPVLPPLAIALAAAVHSRLGARAGARDPWLAAGGTVAALAVATVALVFARVPPAPLDVPAWVLRLASAAALAAAVGVSWASWRSQRHLTGVVAAAGIVVLLGLHYGIASAPGAEAVQRVAAAVRPHAARGIPWTTHQVFVRNLVFYVGSRQEGPYEEVPALAARLQAAEPILVVLDVTDLERIEPRAGVPLVRLDTWEYFNIAAVRLRTLVDPGHKREFRTVALVANPAAAVLVDR